MNIFWNRSTIIKTSRKRSGEVICHPQNRFTRQMKNANKAMNVCLDFFSCIRFVFFTHYNHNKNKWEDYLPLTLYKNMPNKQAIPLTKPNPGDSFEVPVTVPFPVLLISPPADSLTGSSVS